MGLPSLMAPTLDVNTDNAEYSGMGAAQAAGIRVREAVHRDDLERHAGKWRASVASARLKKVKFVFAGPMDNIDGFGSWLPLLDAEGNIIKMVRGRNRHRRP